MTERARTFLREIYGVPEAKIDLIAHGIPDMPFVDPNPYKDQFGVEGRLVALTFGLLSPNKGIEHMLRAVPEILEAFPDFVYIVLGATHPDLVREQGERYRLSLERLARDLGISKHVIFYNRFVELKELTEFIRAADVYVTPYLNPAQITSGTLAYSFGCGKAIVSTPYWHAEELLADGRGVLVPFADPTALAREICGLLRRRAAAARDVRAGVPAGPRDDLGAVRAPLHGVVPAGPPRPPGPAVQAAGGAHARRAAGRAARLAARPPGAADRRDGHAPARHLHHPQLRGGVLHRRQRPRPAADGAPGGAGPGRAGGPAARHDLRRVPPGGLRPASGGGSATSWASTAAGWRRSARRTPTGGRSGRWAPASAGRGGPTCRPGPPRTSSWPCRPILETTSPRAWAFGLLGIREYLRRFGGDRLAGQVRDTLTARLVDLYDRTATPDWPWFEEILSYDNARLPQALIASGRDERRTPGPWRSACTPWAGWSTVQTAPQEHFRAIGCQRLLPQGAASRPGSTSSRSRPTRRSPPAWRRTGSPRTPSG